MSCEGDHEIQDARTGLHKVMVTEEAAVLLLLFVVFMFSFCFGTVTLQDGASTVVTFTTRKDSRALLLDGNDCDT